MDIRVNIGILNRKMGDIINVGDEYYDIFKVWAGNKDRKMGVIICEFIENNEASQVVTESKEDSTTEDNKEQVNNKEDTAEEYICELCGYIAKTKNALHMHKLGKHKDKDA